MRPGLALPTLRSPSNSVRMRASSSATSPRTSRQFGPTDSRVDEKTTIGLARQTRPNSRIPSVADGSDSEVGQYAAMPSYSRRP